MSDEEDENERAEGEPLISGKDGSVSYTIKVAFVRLIQGDS